MSKIIKNFSEFESTNEDFNLDSLLGSVGEAGAGLLKSKIVEYLYGYLGVTPQSLLGLIISKAAQTVDFSEYWDIITGQGDFPISKIAPKFADATIEIIADRGIDGIATSVNSTLDPNGLIYRAFKEMITDQARQEDFRENLITMWTWILSAGKGGASGSSKKKGLFSINKEEAGKLASDPKVKKQGYNVGDIMKYFGGENSNPATGTTEG